MCDIQETNEEACKGRHAMSTCHTFQRVAMQVVQKVESGSTVHVITADAQTRTYHCDNLIRLKVAW